MNMADRKVIKQYSGTLGVSQAAEGIAKALRNAQSLVEDAELLFQNGRWARATALAILAIEEAGKPAVIRSVLLARDDSERREEWRAYRTHAKKNDMWILPDLFQKGARALDDFQSVVDPESDHPQVLDAVKQAAFYTDAYGTCHWSLPDEVIKEGFAKSMILLARGFAKGEGALSSVEELDIWVKHMRPVWKGEMWEMKQALAACYREAEERGILRGRTTASEMAKFLFGVE